MDYAAAIEYLKANNITKDDGTFYEYGEVIFLFQIFEGKWALIMDHLYQPRDSGRVNFLYVSFCDW